jgi:hypothetical protein
MVPCSIQALRGQNLAIECPFHHAQDADHLGSGVSPLMSAQNLDDTYRALTGQRAEIRDLEQAQGIYQTGPLCQLHARASRPGVRRPSP